MLTLLKLTSRAPSTYQQRQLGESKTFSQGAAGLTAGQQQAKNACGQCYLITENVPPQY